MPWSYEFMSALMEITEKQFKYFFFFYVLRVENTLFSLYLPETFFYKQSISMLQRLNKVTKIK